MPDKYPSKATAARLADPLGVYINVSDVQAPSVLVPLLRTVWPVQTERSTTLYMCAEASLSYHSYDMMSTWGKKRKQQKTSTPVLLTWSGALEASPGNPKQLLMSNLCLSFSGEFPLCTSGGTIF